MRLADGQPWHLAGLWNAWMDPATGEVHESYTMITMNCDEHALLKRLHKPERDHETGEVLPPEKQDKRSVVPVEINDLRTWLSGTADQARALLKLPDEAAFIAGPAV
jgi:hypothetical protein